MAKQVAPAAFDFELVEDDHLRAAIASSSRISAWIESSRLKLRYRIGKGDFGDVWLGTDHQSAEDDDGCREVAVKLFPRVKEDRMNALLDKLLNGLFSKCQGLGGVCSLYGFSIIGGKICIVMKFYEGSIADKVSRLREGKISVPDVLRYGIALARGILELHSKGIFVLNVKPSNVLLDENDNAILGDFGVPYLLLGGSSPSANMVRRLGTPSYMAPEQWQPEVRGPIGFETDSWGFGCTIVEMLTGVHPWCGKSDDEVYHAVVRKQEKPQIPCDLPPPVENLLRGCFEYDLRNRPLMSDILQVFKSSQNSSLGNGTTQPPPRNSLGYSEWLLLKDSMLVGDTVRSRKPSNSCKPESMNVPEGTVVGLERDTDREGFVLVRVHGIHDPLRLHVSSLERITLGLAAGDWLRLKEDHKKHSPMGILHSIHRNGRVAVGFIGIETLREGNSGEFEMAKAYCPGQFVRVKPNVLSPRFEWPRIRRGSWATGKIQWVLPNGCLVVKFPGILTLKEESSEFLADPAEVELVAFDTCPCLVKKYQHLEDFHWAVRPVLIAVGIFTTVKLGAFVGGKVGWKSKGKKQLGVDSENESHAPRVDGKNTGSSAWVHPKVANILFREGVSTTPSR